MNASAFALSGRISCAEVLPPYSWIAAYLTSPSDPTETETPSASADNFCRDGGLKRAGLRIERSAGKLVVFDSVDERGGEFVCLGGERRRQRGRHGVEPRAGLIEAVKGNRRHQTATRYIRLQHRKHRRRNGAGVIGDRLLPADRLRGSPICSAARNRAAASSSVACATS